MGIFLVETPLKAIVCGKCGTVFAMSQALMIERKGNHQSFYCPNGHCRSFAQETEAEGLRKALEAQVPKINAIKGERDRLLSQERKLKSQITKLKKRLEAQK